MLEIHWRHLWGRLTLPVRSSQWFSMTTTMSSMEVEKENPYRLSGGEGAGEDFVEGTSAPPPWQTR